MRKAEATRTKELPIHSVWARHQRPCPTIWGCLVCGFGGGGGVLGVVA